MFSHRSTWLRGQYGLPTIDSLPVFPMSATLASWVGCSESVSNSVKEPARSPRQINSLGCGFYHKPISPTNMSTCPSLSKSPTARLWGWKRFSLTICMTESGPSYYASLPHILSASHITRSRIPSSFKLALVPEFQKTPIHRMSSRGTLWVLSLTISCPDLSKVWRYLGLPQPRLPRRRRGQPQPNSQH